MAPRTDPDRGQDPAATAVATAAATDAPAEAAGLSEAERFLYAVTHDLKSHFRALRVIPEWIAEDLQAAGITLPAEVAEHLRMLQSRTAGLDRMLEALTTLSRVGRGAEPAEDHPLDALVQAAWGAEPRGVARLRLQLPAPSPMVHGPRGDLLRLFAALLSNAVVHDPGPAPRVTVTATRRGARLDLRLCDSGPGIDPAFHRKVFAPLQTLRPQDETGGSGMGLAIAGKVVRGLGGAITIAGPGPGCCLCFDLPAGAAPEGLASQDHAAQE